MSERKSVLHRFFGAIWSIIKSYFISVGVIVTLFFIMVVFFIARSADSGFHKIKITTPELSQDEALLVMELEGAISEQAKPIDDFFIRVFERRRIHHLSTIRSTLRDAAKDSRIKGVVVKIKQIQASASSIQEIRRTLDYYKSTSQNPVFVHLDSLSTATYYLASIANGINMPESGDIDLMTPAMQLVYFGDAFKKLGVGFDVVRSGQYKSAFEPFIANHPSQPSVEMYESLVESMRSNLYQPIAAARKKDIGVITDWYSNVFYKTSSALELGIIDSIMYYDDFVEKLKKDLNVTRVHKFKTYTDAIADEAPRYPKSTGEEGIALIEAHGQIIMDTGRYEEDTITPGQINPQFEWARKNEKIKAVVFRINSPGGSALASDLIWDEVAKTAAVKPVVASFADVAASGGYYIASAANHIIAEDTTITGSIGVIGLFPNLAGFSEKYGVSFHYIGDSARKNLLSTGEKASPEDLKHLEDLITETYQLFLKRVSEGRKMPVEEVDKIARGRVWTGTQGLERKIVDSIGGLYEGFQVAKKLAGLDENLLYPIHFYKGKPMSISDCFERQEDFFQCINELESVVGTRISSLIGTEDKIVSTLPLDERQKAQLNSAWKILEISRQDQSLAIFPHRMIFR